MKIVFCRPSQSSSVNPQEEKNTEVYNESPRSNEFKTRGAILQGLDFHKNRLTAKGHMEKIVAHLVPPDKVHQLSDRLIGSCGNAVLARLHDWEAFKALVQSESQNIYQVNASY